MANRLGITSVGTLKQVLTLVVPWPTFAFYEKKKRKKKKKPTSVAVLWMLQDGVKKTTDATGEVPAAIK